MGGFYVLKICYKTYKIIVSIFANAKYFIYLYIIIIKRGGNSTIQRNIMGAIKSISISGDRVAVELSDNKICQFVVWDLNENDHKLLEDQIYTAFSICSDLQSIEKHLQINGFDASLEDIYE